MKRLCGVLLCFLCASFSVRATAQTSPGTITTIAGTGTAGFSGDGGPATSAQFNSLTDVAVDAKGNIYIADFLNNRVRRIAPDGTITTFAGGATGVPVGTGNGLPAAQAVVIGPSRVTVDRDGNVYISDSGSQRVARVGTDGVFRTIAGGTSILGGFAGDGGQATQARLNTPQGLAVDGSGNLYIVDQLNNRIRKVDPSGVITTFAGTGVAGFSGDGGQAAQAQIRPGAGGLAMDGSGNLYIADQLNNRIRKVNPSGVITTVAGGGTNTGENVPATQARITSASGVVTGLDGSLFITDLASIRRVGPDGLIATVAGTGRAGFSGDGGPATQAQVSRPGAVALDGSGNIYIADTNNNRIRRVVGAIFTPGGGGQQAPSISLSGAALAFEGTEAGKTSQKMLTVSNTGNASLSVTGITVTGTDAAQFKVSPTSGTAEAGKSLTVTVTFAPASAGAKGATLSIAHNATGSPSTVALSGTGVVTATPSTGLTPKAGDGTNSLGVGDAKTSALGSVKAGQQFSLPITFNQEVTASTGFQVKLTFDPAKLKVVAGVKGSVFSAAIDLSPQAKDSTVTWGASFLGSSATAKGLLGTLTFEALEGFSGEVEIVLAEVSIKISGGSRDFKPGASVVISSGAVAGGGPPSPDFDGDGEVGFNDFFAFAGAFGQPGTGANAKFDLDGDGSVGFGDFFAFAADFGKKR